jgi:hypothetical protein
VEKCKPLVLGGAWAGQFIMTGVYVSCYYVVIKSVDVWFALEVGSGACEIAISSTRVES